MAAASHYHGLKERLCFGELVEVELAATLGGSLKNHSDMRLDSYQVRMVELEPLSDQNHSAVALNPLTRYATRIVLAYSYLRSL
jgi:hypothetical protein